MRTRPAAVVAIGAAILMAIPPVGAHFTQNTAHLGLHAWTQVVRSRVYTRAQVNKRTYTRAQANAKFVEDHCTLVPHTPDAACRTVTAATTVDDPANTVGRPSSIAIGVDGRPVIAYFDATAEALKVAHCNDVACTGGDETISTVDDPANVVGEFASIAIGADGLPVIAYLDRTDGALKVAHCNDVGCTGADEDITTVDDPSNDIRGHMSIAIGVDGLPVMSYFDFTAGSLKVAHCNDVGCTGADEDVTTVDDPGGVVGVYTSIAIGADGLPIISHQGPSSTLRVTHCNDVACVGGDETSTTVDDPANSVGSYTSIAIGSDGLPVISYYDGSDDALRVAHCNDPSCVGGDETISTVDDPANLVGQSTSITIAGDGLPVISYRDETAGALKSAHCNDLACSGGDESTFVIDDPANAVGQATSIALGADGLLVISYWDQTAGALKVAHVSGV